MKKRAISIVLTITMILTMLPTVALATGTTSELKMHLVGENGEVLSSLEGQAYWAWTARFYLHESDGTTETLIPPTSLTLPSFLKLEFTGDGGLCCLKATGAGTGSISYTDSNGTYTMPVTISLPDLGLYTSLSPDGTIDASSLVEDITIGAGSSVYYIALSPDLVTRGLEMTAVSEEFGDEVTGTNLTKIGTVALSADGSYAAVTVTDLAAEGHHHFEATVKDPNSDSSDMKWGRSVWINNDMPRLYYCDLIQEEGRWTVNYDPRSDWWCCPGSGRPVCFYFGSKSAVQAGNCAPLSMDDLSFPAYMKVSETTDEDRTVPANALNVDTFRFANEGESTDIIYKKDLKYKISAEPQLPEIGFYTEPAASEDGYIYDGNPFVVTETNRTFYVCANAPSRYQLTDITWNDPDLAGLFTVTPDEDGAYLEITVQDGVVVPNGWFDAEISYQYQQDENNWSAERTGAGAFLKNGQPALMYRHLDWNEATQAWYESEERPMETSLTLSTGDSCPVQFYYGTSEENTKVELSDLTFTADILQVYVQEGVAWVKGIGFEESGTITYTKDGVTAAMNVNVTQPDFGFYSDITPSKAAYLGNEVPVSSPNNAFYIVAGQNCTIPKIEAIRNDQTGGDATDSFAVMIDENGGYACIQMKHDTDGNLPAGGDYIVLVEQDWGTRYLHFKLIRNDLPALSTPTDLEWNKQYEWRSAQHNPYSLNDEAEELNDRNGEWVYTERMGAMSFKVGELAQNRFAVEIYSAADSYTSPVVSGSWHFGDMDHSAYFSVTDFIYAGLPSSTYKFRVRAEGDGTVYRDSEWSEMSDVFEYTMPSAQLSAPDTATFAWSKDDGHYFSTWQHTGETGTGYYEINWYYKDGDDYRHASAGCFDIGVWDADADSIYDAMLPDELLEEHGNVNVYYCVRAIPADITQYRISEWSDFSEALDVNNVTANINQKLDNLLNGNSSSGPAATVEEVQTALVNETAELHTAMAADLELSGGPSSGTLERIQALENAVSDAVDQKIEAKPNAPQQIKDIATGITMIGATLNLADKNPESGTKPTVTLELDEPKSGIVIAEQQHNAVQFSMKLNGAIDKDDQEQTGQQLIVPVVIDMPVPAGINPDFLVVLHKLWDGTIEQIRPYIYWNETDGRAHARFVVDSFSDFALVEYNYRPAPTTPSAGQIQVEQPQNGKVSLSSDSPVKGANVSITVSPDEGYVLESLTVTDQNGNPVQLIDNGNGEFVFTAPGGKVSVKAVFAPVKLPFTDVSEGSYYYEAVKWALAHGITDGLTATTFAPNEVCTRAQIVTFLWRAAGCPEPESSENPFTDVKEGTYYYKAVLWAVENGITDGTGADSFSPDATCTRDQTVTFLWRAAGKTAAADELSFTDMSADAYYASAVQWAAENGITDGTGDGTTFSPQNDCTRAQIVTFLYRWLVK